MNRAEFCALPLGTALGLLWDIGLDVKLASVEAPKAPRPPKFDFAIYRKDGMQWASETGAESLEWWMNRYETDAARGGEWAEKDAKKAKNLKYWLDWRAADPNAIWRGERDHEQVTASAPSHKPTVYPRDRATATTRPAPVSPTNFDTDSDAPF